MSVVLLGMHNLELWQSDTPYNVLNNSRHMWCSSSRMQGLEISSLLLHLLVWSNLHFATFRNCFCCILRKCAPDNWPVRFISGTYFLVKWNKLVFKHLHSNSSIRCWKYPPFIMVFISLRKVLGAPHNTKGILLNWKIPLQEDQERILGHLHHHWVATCKSNLETL